MKNAVAEFPPEPGEPIPRHRLVKNKSTLISSPKAGMDQVWVESLLEADAWYMLEGDPSVVSLAAQSIKIPLNRTGSRWTTLDIGTHSIDGAQTHIEIKPVDNLVENEAGELAPKNWDTITRYAAKRGLNVHFLTDKDLMAARFTIQNWRTLLPIVWDARHDPHPEIAFEICAIVASLDGPSTFEVLRHLPYDRQYEATNEIGNLLHQGKITSDLNTRRWSYESSLTSVIGEAHE